MNEDTITAVKSLLRRGIAPREVAKMTGIKAPAVMKIQDQLMAAARTAEASWATCVCGRRGKRADGAVDNDGRWWCADCNNPGEF